MEFIRKETSGEKKRVPDKVADTRPITPYTICSRYEFQTFNRNRE